MLLHARSARAGSRSEYRRLAAPPATEETRWMSARSSTRDGGPVVLAVCAAALCLSVSAAHGQISVRVRAATRIELQPDPRDGAVVGRLLDDQGQPLPDRDMTAIVDAPGGAHSARTRTDATGRFAVGRRAPFGDETIRASFPGDELHEGSEASLTLSGSAPFGAEDARGPKRIGVDRPSSTWLLVPVGLCVVALLAAGRLGGRAAPSRGLDAARSRRRGGGRTAAEGPGLEAGPSLRARAAEAFRPAALVVLPSPGLWGLATPRETLDHARNRSGGIAPSLQSLAEDVERTCYGPEAPTDAGVETLEALGEQVAETLRATRA